MTALAPLPPLTGTEPCRLPGSDPDDWFERPTPEAKQACLGCPMRLPCLAYALDHPAATRYGLWAGTSSRRRAFLRRTYGMTTFTDTEPE